MTLPGLVFNRIVWLFPKNEKSNLWRYPFGTLMLFRLLLLLAFPTALQERRVTLGRPKVHCETTRPEQRLQSLTFLLALRRSALRLAFSSSLRSSSPLIAPWNTDAASHLTPSFTGCCPIQSHRSVTWDRVVASLGSEVAAPHSICSSGCWTGAPVETPANSVSGQN